MDDKQLLRQWSGGDGRAGQQLFKRHFRRVYRFFSNKVDSTDAEELTQETFMECMDAITRYRGEGSFRALLFSVARNRLFLYFRRRRSKDDKTEPGTVSVMDLGASVGHRAHASERRRWVAQALRRIPLDYQIVVELHYWEEMRAEDIAEVLEIPVGTVKTRIRRARQLMSTELSSLTPAMAAQLSTVAALGDGIVELREEYEQQRGA